MENFVSNSACAEMQDYNDFLAFCKKREEKTSWMDVSPLDIHFDPLPDEPLMAPAYAEKYRTNSEAVEEVMMPIHSGLIMPTYGPVGDTAIKTIMDRMGVRWAFWDRQHGNVNVLAGDINSSFNMMVKPVKLKVGDEMVRAILSSRYMPVPTTTLFPAVDTFLAKEYPDAKFSGAFWSHSVVHATWNLDQYTDRFFKAAQMLQQTNIAPALYVQTSDVTSSAIVVRPTLRINDVYSPLLSKSWTRHLGNEEDIAARINETLETAMASFMEAIDEVERLGNVTVKNAPGALLRAFKEIQWPKRAKKYALEAAEIFAELHETDKSATAFECYLSIVDALSFYNRDHSKEADADLEFRLNDSVARSIRLDWTALDLPGAFSY